MANKIDVLAVPVTVKVVPVAVPKPNEVAVALVKIPLVAKRLVPVAAPNPKLVAVAFAAKRIDVLAVPVIVRLVPVALVKVMPVEETVGVRSLVVDTAPRAVTFPLEDTSN